LANRDLIAQNVRGPLPAACAGVVLAFQADMWDPAELAKDATTFPGGYSALVQQIGTLAARFGGPVLLLEVISHVWRVDHPFTRQPPVYHVPEHARGAKRDRLVVDGSTSPTSYTRLTINPARNAELFTLTRVPLVPGH